MSLLFVNHSLKLQYKSKFTLIYEYTLDSTEVAFFVYEADDNKSKIDVVSNNSRLAKFVYDKLVVYMQK